MQYTVLYYQCFEISFTNNFTAVLQAKCFPFWFLFVIKCSLQRITLCLSSEMSHLTYLTFDLKCFTTVTSCAPDED